MKLKHAAGLLGVRLHQFLSASSLFDKRVSFGAAHVFFPGCGMAGRGPELVMRVYDLLLEIYPGIGLFGSCCAKPSQALSGQIFRERVNVLSKNFDEAGVGGAIIACPNCAAALKHIPNLEIIPIWRVLDENFDRLEDRIEIKSLNLPAMTLHDPCPTRGDPDVQRAVRSVMRRLGAEFSEFPQGKRAMCCGKAGMLMATNPGASRKILERCVAQSPTSALLTYCFSCADSFRGVGRRSVHALEILFADSGFDKTQGSVWRNRFRASRFIAGLGRGSEGMK